MTSNDTKGICRFCMKSFSGRSMARHITTCKVKKEDDARAAAGKNKKDLIYQIKISGYKIYWLHIEMKDIKKLADLDKFLRNIWCECCDHLSEFSINGIRYTYPLPGESQIFSLSSGPPTKSMNTQLIKALDEKDTFTYDYDFGSTTRLEGQVVAIREGYLKEPVKILARNNPLEFYCEKCGKAATELCVECGIFYCDRCLPKHECGDEMGMPVVNSPRMGECAYTGEYDFDDFSVTSE